MSNCPYLLPRVREGLRMGNGEIVDSMINDGLWCAFENYHMGNAGEVVAECYHVGRDAQDAFAAAATRRPRARPRDGLFRGRDPADRDSAAEAAPPVIFDRDESIRADTTVDVARGAEAGVQEGRNRHRRQRAARQRRRVGARRHVRRARALRSASTPLARIVGQATSGLAPKLVLMTPVEAVRRVLHENRLDARRTSISSS